MMGESPCPLIYPAKRERRKDTHKIHFHNTTTATTTSTTLHICIPFGRTIDFDVADVLIQFNNSAIDYIVCFVFLRFHLF